MKVYGIKSCDKVRAAMKALEAAGYAPGLVDIRETPLGAAAFERFHAAFGAALVNRKSTTWRGLGEDERQADVMALLAAHPTLMKRPVIEGEGRLTLGWDKEAQAVWL
ncbi:arsenate reductase family protein [Maritimibacter sp. DP1N21-5]|uniref:arsenate reductase family protein n=1 Tax=Maritimibacter sp. DP1N21-5 TaxID=2836867 RepID=UPI001C447600|nr:ArsC/Spx/MgsR family protein [Maritimibacter sp. DP1N21-5]MBV7410289.1 arsenate reductase [Maritimibacter sp. DP1N21-5]